MVSGCIDGSSTPPKEQDDVAVLPDIQAPLPYFLQNVYPEPGSQIAQMAYRTGSVDIENRWYYRLSGAICANLDQKSLLEQNDYNFNSRNYVGGSYLRVNTLGPSSYSIPVRNDLVRTSEAGGALSDERGNYIGGILIICWEVELAPGVYEATYEYTQTSGNVLSYTWSFEITE
jgi:hypothetical protein